MYATHHQSTRKVTYPFDRAKEVLFPLNLAYAIALAVKIANVSRSNG